MRFGRAVSCAVLACLSGGTAMAADFSVTGFGTVGYAQSDQDYDYQRFISKRGSFERDSILGVQADARMSEQWSATLQLKLAPSESSDSRWDSSVSWAFLSYRPSNDWLFRLGKLRIPLYLNSENMDVGATYDFARLPTEMYSVSPTTDFTGLSVTKTWGFEHGDLNIDGYWGKAKSHWRYFMRDDLSAFGRDKRGSVFSPIEIDSSGLVLTAQVKDHRFRAGVHKSETRGRDGGMLIRDIAYGNISQLPFLTVYGYQPTGFTRSVDSTTVTLGADVALGGGFRGIAEIARRQFSGSVAPPNATGAYVALLKESGPWTPYVSVARLLSSADSRKRYQAVDGTVITAADVAVLGPAAESIAAALTAAQRSLADALPTYDQTTIALGASYKLTPTQKIKAEWARTHVGAMSSLVDAPAGSATGHRVINVISVSYNFVF